MKKLIYRLFGIKRYFLISYTFSTDRNEQGRGQINVTTYNGYYVPKYGFMELAMDSIKQMGGKDIVINNIIELSRSDYNDFNNKEIK